MSMIFPGMDPYLEDPALWHSIHQRLAVYIADVLAMKLEPRYATSVEERVYVEGPSREIEPDVSLRRTRVNSAGPVVAVADTDEAVVVQVPSLEVHESYIAILDLKTNQRVVAVLELLSPANKYAGPGRVSYQTKQREVLNSETHLIEIDLLRAGPHVLAVPEWAARGQGPYDYLICINPAEGLRDRFILYPRRLRERLPRIAVPLADGDVPVSLDLQTVLAQLYQMASIRNRLDYSAPCIPALAPEDQEWANQLIRQATPPTA